MVQKKLKKNQSKKCCVSTNIIECERTMKWTNGQKPMCCCICCAMYVNIVLESFFGMW